MNPSQIIYPLGRKTNGHSYTPLEGLGKKPFKLHTHRSWEIGGINCGVSPKTIHSPPPFGLGLHHSSQRYTTRVLDTVHKAHLHSPLHSQRVPGHLMQPLLTFLLCLKQNLPPSPPLRLEPLGSMPGISKTLPHGVQAVEPRHPPRCLVLRWLLLCKDKQGWGCSNHSRRECPDGTHPRCTRYISQRTFGCFFWPRNCLPPTPPSTWITMELP